MFTIYTRKELVKISPEYNLISERNRYVLFDWNNMACFFKDWVDLREYLILYYKLNSMQANRLIFKINKDADVYNRLKSK